MGSSHERTDENAGAPILARKDAAAPSVFSPGTVLHEAQRQRHLTALRVPRVCLLDPDGDIVRSLVRSGQCRLSDTWGCYHTELYEFELNGTQVGVVGCAVGAPFAVLVAEQMFACGCELLISITSAGQIAPAKEPPYFVLITRALRDEGTSYHYLAPSRYAEAPADLLDAARAALRGAGLDICEGPSWTTDAPYRETKEGVAAAEAEHILAVEMECAALYAFAHAAGRQVLCLAHVTNTMGSSLLEFEKGEGDGVTASLVLLAALVSQRLTPRTQ